MSDRAHERRAALRRAARRVRHLLRAPWRLYMTVEDVYRAHERGHDLEHAGNERQSEPALPAA